MLDMLKYIDARLGEPSTWASIGMVLTVLHVNVDPGTLHAASLWGAVLAGVLGVLLSEVGKKPPMEIASDLLAALVTGIKMLPAPSAPPASPAGTITGPVAQ